MSWISAFLAAWGRALVGSLPDRLAAALGFGRRFLIVTADPGGWRIRMDGGAERTVPEGDLARAVGRTRAAPVLALPEHDAVRARLTLPETAIRALDEVVDAEINRVTPFRADEVVRARRVAGAGGGQLRVDLTVVPRARLAAAVAALRAEGVEPAAAMVAPLPPLASPADVLAADLLGTASGLGRPGPVGPVIAVTALLAVAAALAPAVAEWRIAQELRVARATLADRSDIVVDAMSSLELAEARLAELARFRDSAPPTVELIESLSAALPDGSWLTGLEIAAGRVVLEGRSTDAAHLVGLLADSPPFGAAAFAAPVTRDPATGADRFRLSLEVARR